MCSHFRCVCPFIICLKSRTAIILLQVAAAAAAAGIKRMNYVTKSYIDEFLAKLNSITSCLESWRNFKYKLCEYSTLIRVIRFIYSNVAIYTQSMCHMIDSSFPPEKRSSHTIHSKYD